MTRCWFLVSEVMSRWLEALRPLVTTANRCRAFHKYRKKQAYLDVMLLLSRVFNVNNHLMSKPTHVCHRERQCFTSSDFPMAWRLRQHECDLFAHQCNSPILKRSYISRMHFLQDSLTASCHLNSIMRTPWHQCTWIPQLRCITHCRAVIACR